jgi:hypothetical protein
MSSAIAGGSDRMDGRLLRIERRLDLVDAPLARLLPSALRQARAGIARRPLSAKVLFCRVFSGSFGVPAGAASEALPVASRPGAPAWSIFSAASERKSSASTEPW